MQINLPIAICLFENFKKGEPYRDIGIHQIRPDNPRSILQYSTEGTNKQSELVHHVVIFTPLSYAECQKAIRERIALFSGAILVGKTKQIVGSRQRIVDAMSSISLDSSWLLDIQNDRLRANYPRHAGRYGGGHDVDTDEEDSSEGLDDFIDDDEDEEDDEDEDEDEEDEEEEDEEEEDERPNKKTRSSYN